MDDLKTTRYLGHYQLWGGVLGLVFFAWALLNTAVITGPLLFLYLLLCALQVFSVYCGRALLVNQATGIALSSINQALQVIAFAVGGYALKFIAGIGILVGVNLTKGANAIFNISLSTTEITINQEPDLLTISVNLLALWLLVLLGKLQARSRERAHERMNTLV